MAKKGKKLKFNRLVDSFLTKRHWAIDEAWGLEQLAQYVEEIEQVSDGVINFKDLNYSDKRKNQACCVLSSSKANGVQRYSLSSEDIPEGSIAHLQLRGVMRMEDGLSSRGIRSLCNEVGLCNQNTNISGIILEVNSGGGESLAGHFLNSAIKDSNIPVVVWGHFVGSAAVNGTAPADHIMLASNGAEIGSIGTMVSLDKEYIEWYKDNIKDIYSDKSPDKNKWFREILKGNDKPLIEELDKNVTAFHDNVMEFRTLPKNSKEETLRGGMFIAQDALERGLADSVGTFHDATSQLMNIINGDINNLNDNTMDFKSAYSNLIAFVNDFFSWDLKSDSTEANVKEKFDSLTGTLKDVVSAAVVELTESFQSTIKEMKENLEKSNATVSDLQSKIETLSKTDVDDELKNELDKLKANFTTMEKAKEEADKEKKDLETKIAELTGEAGDEGNSGSAFNGSAGEFMDAVGNIGIDGESKY